ncbi:MULTISPECIES: hypothetical protein [Cysteiniphilum]|uniref:Uncharacterized protein n=1 Tax=Cysteiniphilum litorale TaxID=2056700 RepID=A0A8J2Z5R1_9GAMM|nr:MULTISPECIES: hypothetical protein [Cysteiniphilum]GGG01902.1 hypothetical protein GCM10010995_19210 [Cysteiniphilum litorale]
MNRLNYLSPLVFIVFGLAASSAVYYSQMLAIIGYLIIGIGILYLVIIILYDIIETYLKFFKSKTSKRYAIVFLYAVLLIGLAIVLINKNYLIQQLVTVLSQV